MFKDRNGNYRLKIAFDFDETLTEPTLFYLAQHLIKCGHDVWIMTSRIGTHEEYIAQCERFGISPHGEIRERNIDLYETANELGIADKIIFCNLDSKADAFQQFGFDLLFDDDSDWHCDPICEAGGIAIKV